MTYLYVCQVNGCDKSYVSSGKALLHEIASGHVSFKIVQVDSSR